MKFQTSLRSACAPLAVSVALCSAPALAQQDAEGASEDPGDTIVVVGSRI